MPAAFAVLPLALVVGVLLGMLGGGGAILTVPILTTLLGQTPQEATAGSLVIVGLASVVGIIPYVRAGRVRVTDGVVFGLLGVVGAHVGSRLSAEVRGSVLMLAFSALLLAVAAIMVRRRRRAGGDGDGSVAARGAGRGHSRGWPVRIVAATGVGLLTGFFGVGGGFVIVPALTVVMGLPMTTAVGTSLLVIAINSASALLTRAAGGLDLDWGIVLPFAVVAVLGTLLGGRLAGRVDPRVLNLVFVVLLVVVALGVAAQNLPQLIH